MHQMEDDCNFVPGSGRQIAGEDNMEHHIQPRMAQFQRTTMLTMMSIITSTIPTSVDKLPSAAWKSYKGFAKKYQLQLELADDTISRLLFWVPHSNAAATASPSEGISAESAWREVVYGILSLHRLVQHLAHVDDGDDGNHGKEEEDGPLSSSVSQEMNSFGMSIQTRDSPTIAATSVRIALTVVNSVMPALLAIAQAKTSKVFTSPAEVDERLRRQQQQKQLVSNVRLCLEQVKFLLRTYLMVQYWRQQHDETSSAEGHDDHDRDRSFKTDCHPMIGILLDGGMYRPAPPRQQRRGMPWGEARSLQRRHDYVGKRTGWRIEDGRDQSSKSHDTRITAARYLSRAKSTMVADFLHTLRPLLWALCEARYSDTDATTLRQDGTHRLPPSLFSVTSWSRSDKNLLRGWLLCFVMDLLSIRLLERNSGDINQISTRRKNPFASEELRRRRMRLFLYVLRSPVWSQVAEPVLEGTSRGILQRIPLVGGLAETALWDWILYYKHPFVAEED